MFSYKLIVRFFMGRFVCFKNLKLFQYLYIGKLHVLKGSYLGQAVNKLWRDLLANQAQTAGDNSQMITAKTE